MPAKKVLLDLSKGVHEGVEPSVLGKGWLLECENLVPEPTGGLRCRRGWLKSSTAGAPGTRKGMGIGHFARSSKPRQVQADDGGNSGTGGSPATATATWPTATTDGNLLVLCITYTYGAGASSTTFALTVPGGWVLADRVVDPASSHQHNTLIYYKADAAPESGNVQVTLDPVGVDSFSLDIEVSEHQGVVATSPLDEVAHASGSGTTVSSGTTAAPTNKFAYALTAIGQRGSDASYTAPTNGFTETGEYFQSGGQSINLVRHTNTTDDGAALGHQATSSVSGSYVGVIAVFNYVATATEGFYFIANNAGSSQIDIYKIDRENLSGDTYELLESVMVPPDVVPVSFVAGLGALFYNHPSFTSLRRWKGLTFSPEALTGPAGRFVVFHNQRIWTGGTIGRASDLFYSAVLDGNSWNTTDVTGDYVPISRDDGEFLEDAAPFGGGMVIAKQTTTWWLEGNDKSDFDLQRIGDFGAAPGRTVMPTPIGVIVAGRKQVCLWNGSSFDIISKPIESSYELTGNWITVARQEDHVYIVDEGSGKMFVLNMKTGSWHIETFGSGGDAPACLYNQDFRLLAAPKNGSEWDTLLAYREFPGTPRDKDFDDLSERFAFRTADLAVSGPGYKVSPKHLHARFRQRGGNTEQTGLMVTPYYNGIAKEDFVELIDPTTDAGIVTARIPLPLDEVVDTFGVAIEQTLATGEHSIMEPEELLLEADVREQA